MRIWYLSYERDIGTHTSAGVLIAVAASEAEARQRMCSAPHRVDQRIEIGFDQTPILPTMLEIMTNPIRSCQLDEALVVSSTDAQ